MQRILSKIKERFFWIFCPFGQLHFSQNGEDVVLSKIFDKQAKGFYVDVGAYHPFRYSNTYHFYKKGWRGINIDANAKGIKLFQLFRRRDINLNLAISDKKGKAVFYSFTDGAFNTFDQKIAEEIIKNKRSELIEKKEMSFITLRDVLDEQLEKAQEIDFMNIDVEGLDFEVLKSNDWNKYKPKVILVENLQEAKRQSQIKKYLEQKGYKLNSQVFNTAIYCLTAWQK